jgi:hypothetical protein
LNLILNHDLWHILSRAPRIACVP